MASWCHLQASCSTINISFCNSMLSLVEGCFHLSFTKTVFLGFILTFSQLNLCLLQYLALKFEPLLILIKLNKYLFVSIQKLFSNYILNRTLHVCFKKKFLPVIRHCNCWFLTYLRYPSKAISLAHLSLFLAVAVQKTLMYILPVR